MPTAKSSKTDAPDPSVGIDVTGPGKTPPDTTTRPLIMGHKPLLKDPMVTAEAVTEPVVTPEKLAGPRPNKVVAPIEEAEDLDTEPPKATEAAVSASTMPQVVSDDTAVMEAIAQQAGVSKKATAESEEDKKQQAIIDKHIADKTYFVPIAQTERQKKTQATALLGLLLIVIVGAVLAVDAGIIDLDITLPFDLIKN